jgi:hypothetical protein
MPPVLAVAAIVDIIESLPEIVDAKLTPMHRTRPD